MAKYKTIEEEIKKKIVRKFESGINMSKIAEELEMNRSQVRKVLVENGLYKIVTHEEKRNVVENNKDRILKLYDEGFSIKKIKSILKDDNVVIDLRVLKKSLERWGKDIKLAKDYNRKFKSNDNAFDNYTAESCYWAGIIASDGCIFSHGLASKECNYLSIGVSEVDTEMIEKFKKYIEYDGKLYRGKRSKKNHNDCIEIRVNNINIVRNLQEKFNITSVKSLTYIPPELPEEYKKYFILGLIDGDGCITYSTTNTGRKHFGFSFVGTKESCEYILDYFKSNVKLHKRHKDSDNNNYSFTLQGNVQLYRILTDLYDEKAIELCLKRKYNKFLELKQQIEATYKTNK